MGTTELKLEKKIFSKAALILALELLEGHCQVQVSTSPFSRSYRLRVQWDDSADQKSVEQRVWREIIHAAAYYERRRELAPILQALMKTALAVEQRVFQDELDKSYAAFQERTSPEARSTFGEPVITEDTAGNRLCVAFNTRDSARVLLSLKTCLDGAPRFSTVELQLVSTDTGLELQLRPLGEHARELAATVVRVCYQG